jgi:hypothetical protein
MVNHYVSPRDTMNNTARIGGIALILFALAFITTFALEATRVSLGFEDGDNPEQSVAFIKKHGGIYEASGTLQIFMTITLTVGILAVAETIDQPTPSLLVKSITVFGLFAAAAYFLNGALRLAAARPLLYIDSLRHDWGVTTYLIVQIVGIQGFLQAGIINFSFWAIGVSFVNARRHMFPRALSVLVVFPAFHMFALLFGPLLGKAFDGLYLFYVLSVFGTILWCFLLGILLVRRKPAQ